MDSLPPEILCLVLNGAPTTLRTDARQWSPPGRVRHARPFLDPRWRFAARAVCRLWREVIETPTPLQALAIAHDRRRGRLPTTDDHDEHSDHCPKRIAGRLVHASAVAQWLAAGTGPWAQGDVGAVLAWCEANGGASRGRALMAMIASDAPWAVNAAVAIVRDRSRSADSDDRPRGDGTAEDAGEEEDSPHIWTDRREESAHHAQAIERDMWDVAARTASYRTLAALDAHMSGSHRVHRLDRALDCACRLGRAAIVCTLLDDGARPGPMTWTYAANAPDPGALVALLDRVGDPSPEHAFDASHDYVPIKGAWIYGAAAAGRWRTLAVCKERGIDFDIGAAFIGAARARRTSVLAWLWNSLGHRKGRDGSGSPVIDLAAAARSAVAHHNRGRAHDVDSLAWLCEVAGYVPLAAELAVLVQRACADRQVECVLYMTERWPRDVLSLDATTRKDLFRACLCDGVGSLGRFLSVVDANARPCGPDVARRLDLWEALALARADARHAWTQLPSVAACMRAAHDISRGRAPRAVDVAQIDRLSGNAGIVWRCERECAPGADNAAEAHRLAPIIDEATPCTDGAVLSALAPLATWCRPRPIAPDRFVPGWPRPLAPHLASVDRVPHNTQNERIVQWLASVGLLVPPPPPPLVLRPAPECGR
ncbi:hypothetical protein [Pandoravirus japonicus]|uniref:F-box incomplete domain containing protein n=1 Tax=Pandoravirus japonicus TaxID=2823154 RepID=A0A811BPB7_9VIRU|nr:hypothetical protein [Pandoravirus japonicus]